MRIVSGERTYTIGDVARLLNVSSQRVAALHAEGRLPVEPQTEPVSGTRWWTQSQFEALAKWASTRRQPAARAVAVAL